MVALYLAPLWRVCVVFLISLASAIVLAAPQQGDGKVETNPDVFTLMEQLGYGGAHKECLPEESPPERPSIIVVFVDDAHYADFSAYPGGGYGLISTPWIDSIADNGVRFSDGYTAASICSLSRAALMTSKPPWSVGLPINADLRKKKGII